jgi:sugar/nucleoside kinase (ribokinase family)
MGQPRILECEPSQVNGYGIDTRLLARKHRVQTSATILPIRPNGERPALHTPGATPALTEADVDMTAIETADVLHIGGPDVLGPFAGQPLRRVAESAWRTGAIVTMDVLPPCDHKV